MILDPISNSPVHSFLRLSNLKHIQISIPMISKNHVIFSVSSLTSSFDLGTMSTQKETQRSTVADLASRCNRFKSSLSRSLISSGNPQKIKGRVLDPDLELCWGLKEIFMKVRPETRGAPANLMSPVLPYEIKVLGKGCIEDTTSL